MTGSSISCSFVVAWALVSAGAAAAAPAVPSPFSAMSAGQPAGEWQMVALPGTPPAEFAIVSDDTGPVLQITAEQAASALAFPLERSAASAELLSWRWKIANHIASSDITTRQGDDFPARVYVTFDRDRRELPFGTRTKIRLAKILLGRDIPTAALCYVWARDLPVGTVVPNAYSDTVMMVVVRSGGATPSAWQAEQRNLEQDYRLAFDSEPPPVTAIMVAGDTDDTGASARSWFGDLTLRPAQ